MRDRRSIRCIMNGTASGSRVPRRLLEALLVVVVAAVALHQELPGALGQTTEQLEAIHDHNHSRRSRGRAFSGAIYWLIGMGGMGLAVITAVLLGWFFTPLKAFLLRRRPQWDDAKVIRVNTAAWAVATLLLSFILLAAGGLPGWIVVNFLYAMVSCSIGVLACVVLRGSKKQRQHSAGKGSQTTTRVVPTDAEQPSSSSAAAAANNNNNNKQSLGERCGCGVTEHPEPVGRHQAVLLVVLVCVVVLSLVLVLILFYSWRVSDYQLWSLAEQRAITEYIPPITAKAILLLYSYEGLASNLRCQVFTRIGTTYCGNHFTSTVTGDKKRKAIYDSFVDLYKIDMGIYVPSDWTQYSSVNDWFIRKINATARPAPQPRTNASVIVSPADSRMLVFPTEADRRMWIKERSFTLAELFDGDKALANEFVGGYIVIARLAPQDYHRFNTNMFGTVVSVKSIGGTYWSVNPDAIISKNDAFFNARQLLILQNSQLGKVAYVAIGATCVGSVIIGPQPGDRVNLGDEMGYMQFGGSTVILVFQPGKVRFAPALVAASKVPVETYVTVNTVIGEAASS